YSNIDLINLSKLLYKNVYKILNLYYINYIVFKYNSYIATFTLENLSEDVDTFIYIEYFEVSLKNEIYYSFSEYMNNISACYFHRLNGPCRIIVNVDNNFEIFQENWLTKDLDNYSETFLPVKSTKEFIRY